MNYYNEIDPFAAAWLCKLIAAGHIAPGDVDERSIVDVRPDDLRGYRQCHFFAGIGGWSYALRLAGWTDDRPVWSGSCPCQPFSAAGDQRGSADERHLWPAWFRLIRECNPATIVGEQVAGASGLAWFDHVHADLEECAYAVAAADLCAAGVGAPHIRLRLYFVAHTDDQSGLKSDYPRSRREGNGSQRTDKQPRGGGASGLVADAGEGGRTVVGTPRLHDHRQPGDDDARCGPTDGMVDATGRGCGERGDAPFTRGSGHTDGAVQTLELGDTIGAGSQGLERSGDLELHGAAGPLRPVAAPGATVALADTGNGLFSQPGRGSEERDGPRPAGTNRAATNGFWADAEWIACRDGKWRAVEPGSPPLASGLPNRVGRLRGYGNAICAPLAAEFIRAAVDAIG